MLPGAGAPRAASPLTNGIEECHALDAPHAVGYVWGTGILPLRTGAGRRTGRPGQREAPECPVAVGPPLLLSAQNPAPLVAPSLPGKDALLLVRFKASRMRGCGG